MTNTSSHHKNNFYQPLQSMAESSSQPIQWLKDSSAIYYTWSNDSVILSHILTCHAQVIVDGIFINVVLVHNVC